MRVDKRMFLLAVVGVIALAVLWLSQSSTPAVGQTAVWVQEYSFYPRDITVEKGVELTWVNKGLSAHGVAFDFFGSPLLEPGESWSHVFVEEGVYEYYSPVDDNVTGVVRVTG